MPAKLAAGLAMSERVLAGLSVRLIVGLAAGSLTAIFAVFASTLLVARVDIERSATTALSNLSLSLSQQIARDIDLLDLALLDLRDGAEDDEVLAQPLKIRRSILFDRSATAHGLGAMLLVDTSGHVVAQNTGEALPPVDLSAQNFFRVHANRADMGLYVSQPFVSVLDGEQSIAFSRRVERHGVFAGVAVATVRLSYWRDLFEALDLGPDGAMSLLNDDGVVIIRRPFLAKGTVVSSLPAELRASLTSRLNVVYEAVSPFDGIDRLVSHNPVAGLPLNILVARSTHEIYAAWWRRAALTAVALFVLGNLILVLIAALAITIRHRARAETELAALALTDKLTGLPNRRRFDEALDTEWCRARRNRQPLALLLLDVDLFKDLNDVFGHQGGDAVLAALGGCLRFAPERPADLAARYGGEEFAVLLPDTTEAGALSVARRIEAQVKMLRQPHPRSPEHRLTVSIGVAVLVPDPKETPDLLVRLADQALYGAKRTGRNRVVVWQPAMAA